MSTALNRSSDRGAVSQTDATTDQHLSHEIWNDILTRARGGTNGSSDSTSETPSDPKLDHEDDHVITFSDIFSEIKEAYNKVISILTGSTSDRPDNDPTSFTDRRGRRCTRDADGDWNGPDGKPAHISNVNVMPDGTFSYKETETGNVIVCKTDGSYKTVTPEQFGDLKLYPDAKDRAAENDRLENLAEKPGFLNSDGRKLLSELNKLGIDDTDALYGSHIVFRGDSTRSGDGGALYRQLIDQYPVKERGSSHYPGTKTAQYQIITGPGNSAVLFGLTPGGDTFIQFEKNASGSADHMNDYILYRTLNQNIGPLGTSPYTDKNPLEIGYAK